MDEERTEPRVSHRGKGTEIVTVNILVYTDPVTNYTSSAQARPSQLSVTGQAGARSTYGWTIGYWCSLGEGEPMSSAVWDHQAPLGCLIPMVKQTDLTQFRRIHKIKRQDMGGKTTRWYGTGVRGTQRRRGTWEQAECYKACIGMWFSKNN